MSICLTLNASFSAYSDAGISATGMLARMALAELAATCIPTAILRLGYKSARPGLSALECQTVPGIRSRVSGWRLHPRGAWLQSHAFSSRPWQQAVCANWIQGVFGHLRQWDQQDQSRATAQQCIRIRLIHIWSSVLDIGGHYGAPHCQSRVRQRNCPPHHRGSSIPHRSMNSRAKL